MTQSEALGEVAIFNEIVRKKPWLDVDVAECSPQAVVLHCGIDLSEGPEMEVRFDTVFFASLLMTWKTDTSLPILQVLTGEEAFRINGQYQVEQGYHLFAFQPEYLADGVRCLIAAQAFSWREMART